MPGTEGAEPSQDQVESIRRRVNEEARNVGLEKFYQLDLDKMGNNDWYVKRFFMHVFDLPGDQEDEAVNMIVNTFKWRKELGVNDIKFENLNKLAFEKGALYTHNRDKDGKRLLIFDVKRHIKGVEKMEDMKKFFVYYMERIDREENGDRITVFFDCSNCGLKNMDMEFIQFIINCFKDYYPWMLNYILVFEMPWVLNAAWKIIKAWLPAAGVKLIKFLTKSNLSEYVDEQNALEAWGGSDPWVYDCETEMSLAASPPSYDHVTAPSSLPLTNGLADDNRKKSVTFAEVNLSPSEESLFSLTSHGSPSKQSADAILRLVPNEEVVFSASPAGDLVAKVQVESLSHKITAYKIKTTSPEKYRVRPSSGILAPGGTSLIEIHVAASSVAHAASLVRDKFLITVIYLEKEDLNHQQLQDALKTSKPEGQYRLRCVLAADNPLPTASPLAKTATMGAVVSPEKQMDALVKKVDKLSQQTELLSSQLSANSRVQLLLLLTIVVLLLILVWRTVDQGVQQHIAAPQAAPAGSQQKLDL